MKKAPSSIRRSRSACRGAPPVIAFNPAGDTIYSWGGPGQGYEWPESMHGIFADSKGNIWLGGNGAKDSQILKFTKDGKFIMQSGHQGKNAAATTRKTLGASPRSMSIRNPTKPS